MNLGLLGKKISYSFSQNYFNEKFKNLGLIGYSYEVFDIQNKKEISKLFEKQDLDGFNITIPYKQDIIDFLDEVSLEAEKIGAVNTVKISNGKRKGFNTDVIGFEKSLSPLLEPHHTSALILGSGGASKAVAYVLDQLGVDYSIISRNGEANNYHSLTEKKVSEHYLIINTTPVGTFPDIESYPPFPVSFLNHKHLVYDLIYNPGETKLIQLARERGAKTKNGLEMLYLQAEAAWAIWNSSPHIS